MALAKNVNVAFGGATTGVDWMWTQLVLLTGTVGWSKVRDSDGTTYSSAGTQVTGPGSGANGLRNSLAWCEYASPDAKLHATVQHHSTAGNNLSFRVKLAPNAFTGGSPGATQTGSAVGEAILCGGGTDAAPTFAQVVGQSDGVGYVGSFVAMTTFPWCFGGFCPFAGGGATAAATKFFLDYCGGLTAAGDTFAWVSHVGSAGGGDVFSTTVLTDPTSAQGAPQAWLGLPGVGTFGRVPAMQIAADGGTNLAPDDGSVNPITGKYELLPLYYARRGGLSAPHGRKGQSTLFCWRPVSAWAEGDLVNITGAGDGLVLGEVVLTLWGGDTLSGVAGGTNRGACEIVAAATANTGVPTITNASPAPGTAIASTQSVAFDMTDAVALKYGAVFALFPDGAYEVVHDGAAFAPRYAASSTRTAITGGYHFVILRSTGWTQAPSLVPVAVNSAGNLNA